MADKTILNSTEKLFGLLNLHQRFYSLNDEDCKDDLHAFLHKDGLHAFLHNEMRQLRVMKIIETVNVSRFVIETFKAMSSSIEAKLTAEEYAACIKRNVWLSHTSNDIFTKNLNASQFILAGEIHEAVRLLRTFTFDELLSKYCSITTLTEDKKLAKRMSNEQKTCLSFKLDIILDILLEDCEKLKFIIAD